MYKRCLIFLIIFCFTLSSKAKAADYYYIVKPQDNVSTLLYRARLKPIYHKLGTLEILRKKNNRHIPDLDHLKVGDQLFFPEHLVLKSNAQGFIKVINQNEIVFKDHIEPNSLSKRTIAHKHRSQKNQTKDSIISTPSTTPDEEKRIAPSPTPNAKSQVHEGKLAESQIIFSMGSGYSRMDSSAKTGNANNANAVLLSKPTLSVDLKWEQNWSSSIQSFIRWSFASIPYQDTSRGLVSGEKQNTSLMGLGLTYQLFDEFFGSFELGSREEIFVTSYQPGSATAEARSLTYYRFTFSRKLIAVNNLSMTGAFGASYLSETSGSNYAVDVGEELFLQLHLTQKFKTFSLFAVGEYADSRQDTSFTMQTRRDLKTQLGFIIPLGEEIP